MGKDRPYDAARTYGICVRQPMAWAISAGHRLVDNRSWRPPRAAVGRNVAVLAASTVLHGQDRVLVDRYGLRPPPVARMPRGAVVAVVRLDGLWRVAAGGALEVDLTPDGDDCPPALDELTQRRWAVGPYCWAFSDLRVVDPPVPCLGTFNLFALPPSVARSVASASKKRS